MPFLFGTIIPTCLVLCVFLYDVLNLFQPLRSAFQFIVIPFSDFITLGDLHDPIGKTISPAGWKVRMLCLLPVLESLSWIATLVFSVLVSDHIWSVRAGVSTLLWVQ
jgi:hypothetical protein